MFRSILKIRTISPLSSRIVSHNYKYSAFSQRVNTLHRNFAMSSKDNNEEFVQMRLEEILAKIHSNPGVSKAFSDLQDVIASKGIIKEHNQSLSMSDYYKVLTDSEIRDALKNVRNQMMEANISISPDDIEPLIQSLTKK